MKINSISQVNYTQQNKKSPQFNALHKSFEDLSQTNLKLLTELVSHLKGYYLNVAGNKTNLVIATKEGSNVEKALLLYSEGYTSIDEEQARKLVGNIEIDEKTLGEKV